MSVAISDLGSFSNALVELVANTAHTVVAVKSAAYRVASGVVFRENLIAVANHSLRSTDPIPVQFADGAQIQATVLGRHAGFDLAILKMEGQKLNLLTPSDPARLKAGALIAVVGLTIDVGPSASMGILGAVGGPRRTWRGGTLEHFLRLDVNLYPSQSGAAVVDSAGRLIGMATPSLLRHSAAAVPLATLNRIADELLNQGRIRRGYLGIGVQPIVIPPASRQSGITSDAGLIILSVEPASPAAQANLLLGDILLSLDGHEMTDVDALQTALASENVGRTVEVLLLRGGGSIQVQLTIADRIKKEQ
jgi:serine protease Do